MPERSRSKKSPGTDSKGRTSKSQRSRKTEAKQVPEPPDGHVVVGHITGSWGLRGDVKVQPQSDFPDRFSPGSELHVDGKLETIVASRPHKGGYVIRLTRVTDRTAADSMRGTLITVLEDEIATLPQDTFYHFQLIDMQVFSDEGEKLGVIVEILDTSANDVYVVRGEDRPDVLIPAIRETIVDVDVDEKRMTVHLMPGLR